MKRVGGFEGHSRSFSSFSGKSLRMRMQLVLDPFFPAWGLVPRSAEKSEEKTGPELDYLNASCSDAINIETVKKFRNTYIANDSCVRFFYEQELNVYIIQ